MLFTSRHSPPPQSPFQEARELCNTQSPCFSCLISLGFNISHIFGAKSLLVLPEGSISSFSLRRVLPMDGPPFLPGRFALWALPSQGLIGVMLGIVEEVWHCGEDRSRMTAMSCFSGTLGGAILETSVEIEYTFLASISDELLSFWQGTH